MVGQAMIWLVPRSSERCGGVHAGSRHGRQQGKIQYSVQRLVQSAPSLKHSLRLTEGDLRQADGMKGRIFHR